MKCKQPHPGFVLCLLIPFLTRIAVILSALKNNSVSKSKCFFFFFFFFFILLLFIVVTSIIKNTIKSFRSGWVLWHINHCRLFNVKSSLYIYIRYIGFGWVGFYGHINHCWLFNAKSSLYIYIKYIWFGLVQFYGISTIVGYLMPNPVFTNIKWFENSFCRYIFKQAWAHSFVHS